MEVLCNLSHYSFFTVQNSKEAATRLETSLAATGILGTVLIAPEGVNMNLVGSKETLLHLVTQWLTEEGCKEFDYKLSYSHTAPFKRLRIKAKPEIITMGVPDLDVKKLHSEHISAEDFEKLLKNPGDTIILDTRNDFEFEWGSFKGALKADMKSFRDFPQLAETLPKDKPIVMFCTGGVRCEKASAFLKTKGFDQVRQLKGGILRYLEDRGPELFEGQCFVFDERISLREIPTEEVYDPQQSEPL
jgi:UPF0176 protein